MNDIKIKPYTAPVRTVVVNNSAYRYKSSLEGEISNNSVSFSGGMANNHIVRFFQNWADNKNALKLFQKAVSSLGTNNAPFIQGLESVKDRKTLLKMLRLTYKGGGTLPDPNLTAANYILADSGLIKKVVVKLKEFGVKDPLLEILNAHNPAQYAVFPNIFPALLERLKSHKDIVTDDCIWKLDKIIKKAEEVKAWQPEFVYEIRQTLSSLFSSRFIAK